ncbi:alginate biosynthesis protein [Dinoroseobacter shibae DFL 12 = DSM 16493]|jgi:mannose-1-phosphate guanylyltransferase/mannose-6-phosphate isomerase|uniref:mannose-1-phosphate guanylyltransferase n=2 Tax=Pseudomonadota TaxID=1224 RepID=A8LNC6_DINSH|nr:mannose-1-phosphate guanylyltransferase/mannose-6-phosphate isomerase [Dinoroseobacter shibae]ABV93639.1 alginate biosynthesis protein [Dinoroseobacter shibae DFL 12 = DSM 16493]URF45089.1 mannose-1-phosphate guanylyltransferase/mannose-6-phosphate isomerase [Dinoroseobacter shibae]URF49394.1 mannose-1-phosphate guanylyltransferase/mannose-6-phosphate isomerase [Dinoroseobacter shibae]
MIIPVILAGGSGSRLWPASRKSYPKQFTELVGARSLFQDTLARLQGPHFAAPTIITGDDFRFITAEQLDDAGVTGADILLEPAGRNTAPAILAAALRHEATPDAVLLVSPSDHRIADGAAFLDAVAAGKAAAEEGHLVTFGVTPIAAETGYGYLELSGTPVPGQPQVLKSFVEKPDAAQAAQLLAAGRHLWNAGIFMFKVGTIIDAFERLAPRLVMPVRAAMAAGEDDLCFYRLGAQAYARCEDISIDYAIMEAAEALRVIPVSCGWTDLGSWRSVHGASDQDTEGNTVQGSALQIDCRNSLLKSTAPGTRLVGLGLQNIAAIATDDAILVANLDDSERVKEVVAALKVQGASQAESFRRCHRPWGYFETLSLGERFQVKRIMVKPGAALSLQSHFHRAEHWVVVEGSAHVTVDRDVSLISENQSVYIPLGAVHRLENRGKVPLNLIEVQSGAYLGEDDIVRYEDVYARAPKQNVA